MNWIRISIKISFLHVNNGIILWILYFGGKNINDNS
mgnify:CR=1 FL=1